MYTRFKLTNSDHLIPAQTKCHNTPRGNLLQQKYLQNLNVVFAVVTHSHTTMAIVLLRARSVITAPNTTILPVCVTPKIKSENNSTRIPSMQYGMIFDRHIPITTVTATVTKVPTATRMPLPLVKSKTSPTQVRTTLVQCKPEDRQVNHPFPDWQRFILQHYWWNYVSAYKEEQPKHRSAKIKKTVIRVWKSDALTLGGTVWMRNWIKKANHQCEDRGCERDNGLSLEWSDVHRFKFLNGQSQQRKDEIHFY